MNQHLYENVTLKAPQNQDDPQTDVAEAAQVWLSSHQCDCLFGFNIGFKHLRSYCDGTLTNMLRHTEMPCHRHRT